jgi:hypothetical protein
VKNPTFYNSRVLEVGAPEVRLFFCFRGLSHSFSANFGFLIAIAAQVIDFA